MQTTPRITFRNLEPSPAIEEHIRQRTGELEKYHPRIIGCDVIISAPQKRQVTGRAYEVHLTIRVPGRDIRVSRRVGQSSAKEDVNLAIHKTFDAARAKLKEQKRKMAGVETKHHPPILHGRIDRLFVGEGYGFIRADDGREVYFEQDNLTGGDWTSLQIDMKVRFREEIGGKGPYATNLAIIG